MILFFLLTTIIVLVVLLVAAYGRLTGLRHNAHRAFADVKKPREDFGGAEAQISGGRRAFNHMATEYNAARRQFPAALIAGPMGFQEQAFIDVADNRAGEPDGANLRGPEVAYSVTSSTDPNARLPSRS